MRSILSPPCAHSALQNVHFFCLVQSENKCALNWSSRAAPNRRRTVHIFRIFRLQFIGIFWNIHTHLHTIIMAISFLHFKTISNLIEKNIYDFSAKLHMKNNRFASVEMKTKAKCNRIVWKCESIRPSAFNGFLFCMLVFLPFFVRAIGMDLKWKWS